MQGNSESWRRLDRIRAASAGPAGRRSPGPTSRMVDLGVVAMPAAAPADAGRDEPASSGSPTREPDAVATRRGRHAVRSVDEVAGTSEDAAPDHVAVQRWVPDDESEGPVVGAALDRWVARRGPVGRPDEVVWPSGDAAAVADGSAEDDWPSDSPWAATGSVDPDDTAASGGEASSSAGSGRGRRPVSRWRAHLRRSLGRGAELWVPEPLRAARVDPGRRGAMALLLVAALAAAITAVGVWRDRPEARPVATVAAGSVGLVSADPPTSSDAAGSQAATDPGASGPPTSMSPSTIVVSVTGLVARAGVVTLPGDGRVADAIAAAGGLTDGADITGLNLAAKLTDGASVVVGAAGATVQGTDSGAAGAGTGAPVADAAGRVDLNTADTDELDTLPGVGPVMAGNIIAWRETNGRFTSVDQLQEISGIGPARYAQLSELVTVS